MTGAGWIVAAGAAVAVAVLLWPLRSMPKPPATVAGAPLGPLVSPAAALASGAAGWALSGRVSVGVSVGAMSAAVAVAAEVWVLSRKRIAVTEALSRLAGAVFNQAAVADSVTDALAQACESVAGPVGAAAEAMVQEAQGAGLEVAAERFGRRVGIPAAVWLADVVVVADATGASWAAPVKALEAEVTEAAATARRFGTAVASLMPALVAVLAVCSASVAAVIVTSRDAGRWLLDGPGALLLMTVSALTAAWCVVVLRPARNLVTER